MVVIDLASGDPNLYRYCGNDPVNAVDPSDLDEWDDIFSDVGVQPDRMGGRRGPGTQRGLEAAAQMQAVLTFAGELHPLTQVGEVVHGRDCSGAETSRWKAALWMAVGAVSGGGGSAKAFVRKAAKKVKDVAGRAIQWIAAEVSRAYRKPNPLDNITYSERVVDQLR